MPGLDQRLLTGPRLQPWAAFQRQASDFQASSRGPLESPTLRWGLPLFGQPDRSRTLRSSPTPPEVSRPSGDVSAGVRFARVYHPRHLPPLTFLRPSAVYSSRQIVCLLSYRHHLWDSKNTNNRCRLAILIETTLGTVPSGNTSRARKHGKPSLQGSVAKEASISEHPLLRSSSQTERRRVTHHSSRKQLEQEEGTSTGLPFGPHGQTALSASVVEVSLTTRTASSSNGRRTLRQTRKPKPTTGIGHRCQTQRIRCPNDT